MDSNETSSFYPPLTQMFFFALHQKGEGNDQLVMFECITYLNLKILLTLHLNTWLVLERFEFEWTPLVIQGI